MAFDISTAKPVDSGFDISTAKPVEELPQAPQLYQRQPLPSFATPYNPIMPGAAGLVQAYQTDPKATQQAIKQGLPTAALVGAGLVTRNPLLAGLAYSGAKQLEYGLEGNRVPNEAARFGVDVATGTALDIAPKAVLGAGKIAINKVSELTAPTVEKLTQFRNSAYNRFLNSGVNFDFSTALPQLKQKMIDMGFKAADHPRLAPAMARIEELISEGSNLTAQQVKKLRELFNRATSGEQGILANSLKQDLDTAISQTNSQAAKDLLEGVESHRRLVNSQRINNAIKDAEKSKTTNTAEAIKNNFNKILKNPKGFNDTEKNELLRIAQGTPTQTGMQKIGNLSPGGSFMPNVSQFGYGAGAFNFPIQTAVAAGTALTSKGAVNTLVKSEANALAARIRAGGGAQLPESVVRKVETYAPAGINLMLNPFANQGQQ